MNRHLIAALGILLSLGACSTPGTQERWSVPLAATPAAAGGLARVTLLPAGPATRLEVFFTAAGPQPTLPLHIYTYVYEGSCAQLPATPAFDLNDRVLVRDALGDIVETRRGPFTLSRRVDLPAAALADGRYALALRAAPADGGELLYCATLHRA